MKERIPTWINKNMEKHSCPWGTFLGSELLYLYFYFLVAYTSLFHLFLKKNSMTGTERKFYKLLIMVLSAILCPSPRDTF